MTINEMKAELKDRIEEQEGFERDARRNDDLGAASFHTGKASGLEDALELLSELS